jgi:hypothetical protein
MAKEEIEKRKARDRWGTELGGETGSGEERPLALGREQPALQGYTPEASWYTILL